MTSIYNFTGYHTSATITAEISSGANACEVNIIKISSYIPIVAIFSGMINIYSGITNERLESPLSRVGLVARGILECIGLGLLFLIPDLIVSMHRHFCASPPSLAATHSVKGLNLE